MTTARQIPDLDPRVIVARWSRDWRDESQGRQGADHKYVEDESRRAVRKLKEVSGAGGAERALHRRTLFATQGASLMIRSDLPEEIAYGPFVQGASWQARLRFSSAFPTDRSDDVPDQRGLAASISDGTRRLDLLATTGSAHAARDAAAMVAMLRAAAAGARGSVVGRLRGLAILVRAAGVADGLRMARTISRQAIAGPGLSELTFYSRAPFQLGPWAVRYRFRGHPAEGVSGRGPDALGADLQSMLGEAAVEWHFELQGYIDSAATPIDDHRVEWDSPWLTAGRLVIPKRAPISAEDFRFSVEPRWPDPRGPVMVPIGSLNSLRSAAYAESRSSLPDRVPGAG